MSPLGYQSCSRKMGVEKEGDSTRTPLCSCSHLDTNPALGTSSVGSRQQGVNGSNQ